MSAHSRASSKTFIDSAPSDARVRDCLNEYALMLHEWHGDIAPTIRLRNGFTSRDQRTSNYRDGNGGLKASVVS
ncbi:hypothetical protein BaRGS_00030162 [Batillaria attramentaria]|uniref:Uncharacterized protein n=1 Tax=Batillaria attramentaria TaxID=370345 RepID=A0ABD0JUH2_9CAEN